MGKKIFNKRGAKPVDDRNRIDKRNGKQKKPKEKCVSVIAVYNDWWTSHTCWFKRDKEKNFKRKRNKRDLPMISIEHGSNYRCRVFRIKKQKQNNKQLGGQVSPR